MQGLIDKDTDRKVIETHAHYNMKQFHKNRKELIGKLHSQGIEKIIIPAISYESNFDMREKFNDDFAYKGIIYYAAGIHPKHLFQSRWDSKYSRAERRELGIMPTIEPCQWDNNQDRHFRKFLADNRTVAVGETGLDYSAFSGNDDIKRVQTEYFIRFIEYANEYQKPVILHIRPFSNQDNKGITTHINKEVFYDAMAIMKEHPIKYGAVAHCFSFPKEIAEDFIKVGVNYFGIGGTIGDRASDEFIEMVRWVPLEYILIETDAPYQKFSQDDPSPVTSDTLFQVINRIAESKDIPADNVRKATYENAKRFYRF